MGFNNVHIKNYKSIIDKKLDRLSDQKKALLITFFISGTLLMLVFNSSLKQHDEIASESYYEIEPEKLLTEEEIKQLETLEKLNASKAETNSAFNETHKSKQFAQAYKTIAPPEDFEPEDENAELENIETSKQEYKPIDKERINEEELSSFKKVNELLKKQKEEYNNKKSTVSYSLKDRKKRYIPIPVYLCQENGKIIINIRVNENGSVTDANLNSASTSSNQCLVEHALEYAKKAKFNTDKSKPSQSGSITFNFIGKR